VIRAGPIGAARARADAAADAGIALVATLAARLGTEALTDRLLRLGERAGAANADRKVMTLIYTMALGADLDRYPRRAALGPRRRAAPRALSHRRRGWGPLARLHVSFARRRSKFSGRSRRISSRS
jgi:hypothetical protein